MEFRRSVLLDVTRILCVQFAQNNEYIPDFGSDDAVSRCRDVFPGNYGNENDFTHFRRKKLPSSFYLIHLRTGRPIF